MKYAVLSSKAPDMCVQRLVSLGYTILPLPPFDRLSSPVDTHADMLFFTHGNVIITHREYYKRAKAVFDTLCRDCALNIELCEQKIQSKYPHDIAYNACAVGKTLFAHTKSTSPVILKLAEKTGIAVADTAQGYAACSTLVLDCMHVICADPSLSLEYTKHKIKVTKISNGSVKLFPYDYGFIGGCSGVDGENVFFCGNMDTHSDADLIKSAVAECGMKAVSLSNGELCDIGGIKFFDTDKIFK